MASPLKSLLRQFILFIAFAIKGHLIFQEIREAILYHLTYHKASGPDGVTNEVLKWTLELTQHTCAYIIVQPIVENKL